MCYCPCHLDTFGSQGGGITGITSHCSQCMPPSIYTESSTPYQNSCYKSKRRERYMCYCPLNN